MGCFLVFIILTSHFLASTHGKSTDLNTPADVFQKFHTGIVSIIVDERKKGTGFIIEFPHELVKKTGKKDLQFIITAAHVVKGARNISLNLYMNRKGDDGEWEVKKCLSALHGIDVVRDVALLSITCDKCDCTNLAFLRTRLSKVNAGEKVLVIGDSIKRLSHSLMDGMLSITNIIRSTANVLYTHIKDNTVVAAFNARFHALVGFASHGDSGSAVMDEYGNVIGMNSFIQGDLVYCITVQEILTAFVQILESLSPQFVACTAHESALLGRTYWGETSGKSIQEMNALGAAMDAQYIAVAHNGDQAHAFTFDLLLWTMFPNGDELEEESECICNLSSFTDGIVLRKGNDNMVMCGCSDNSCWINPHYERRFGEDNDRRWAIYKRVSDRAGKSKWFVPDSKSLASMKNIADEVYYWKKKTTEKEELISSYVAHVINMKDEHQFHLALLVALAVVALSFEFYIFLRYKGAESKLKDAITENKRLKKEQAQREVLQNIDDTDIPDRQ